MSLTLRTLGFLVSLFFILVFATACVVFVRRAWFGASGTKAHVAVVEITGILTSSEDVVRKITSVLDQPKAKALVVRVNSPGGMVGPSQEIYEALLMADKKIPVVVSMGSVAASGGYYLALGGRKIYANSGTLTGSIGVIMEFFNTEKLYSWAKIEQFALTAGKMKDAGSPLRKMTHEEKDYFTQLLHSVHSDFIAAVKTRRKLNDEQVAKIADGRVLTGAQALSARLVDSLGGAEVAIADAKGLAGLPESAPVIIEQSKKGLLWSLLFGDEQSAQSALAPFSKAIESLDLQTKGSFRILLQAPVATF